MNKGTVSIFVSLKTKPPADSSRNMIQLIGREHAETANEFGMGYRDDVLRVEDTLL